MNHMTPEECAYARGLFEQGCSQSDIARQMGRTQSTISRVLKRFRETATNQRRPGQGRKRATTRNEDRFLKIQCLRQRFVTSATLLTELRNATGRIINQQTVRNRLKEYHLKPYEAALGPRLERNHKRDRLEFARNHLEWGEEDWSNVLFSDESRFCLYTNDRRQKVYRRPGERYAQCNFKETVGFGGGSVMVWGGISLEAKTDLAVLENLTADQYITEILGPHVMPFAAGMGDAFVLMHDNARPHTARIVTEYLAEVGITVMDWPARSPDLNPIEHLWDDMGKKVRSMQHRPQNLPELMLALQQAWENIDQAYVRSLILSMPHRCQAVINAGGGNTRY